MKPSWPLTPIGGRSEVVGCLPSIWTPNPCPLTGLYAYLRYAHARRHFEAALVHDIYVEFTQDFNSSITLGADAHSSPTHAQHLATAF